MVVGQANLQLTENEAIGLGIISVIEGTYSFIYTLIQVLIKVINGQSF